MAPTDVGGDRGGESGSTVGAGCRGGIVKAQPEELGGIVRVDVDDPCSGRVDGDSSGDRCPGLAWNLRGGHELPGAVRIVPGQPETPFGGGRGHEGRRNGDRGSG